MKMSGFIEAEVNPTFNVLGTDLSFIATKAAIELDMFARGHSEKLESVMLLAKLIRSSIHIEPGGISKSLMNPSTVTVMGKAIENSEWGSFPKTIEELTKIAQELADELDKKPEAQKENGELQKMKGFCIALAKCSSAFRQSIYGQKRRHPYRR